MLLADGERRRALGSIWWYTIEFGLIEEAGQTKAFGAGLMSSYEEIEVAFSDRVKRSPFNPEEMGKVAPSPHAIHQQLWVLESFEQLNEFVHTELERYL
jgi:phenylalanine-4-hydroxylase